MNLFREIVLDVWKDRREETIKLVYALGSRVTELKQRVRRIEDFGLSEFDREICLPGTPRIDRRELGCEATLVTQRMLSAKREGWIYVQRTESRTFNECYFKKGWSSKERVFELLQPLWLSGYLQRIEEGESSLAPPVITR